MGRLTLSEILYFENFGKEVVTGFEVEKNKSGAHNVVLYNYEGHQGKLRIKGENVDVIKGILEGRRNKEVQENKEVKGKVKGFHLGAIEHKIRYHQETVRGVYLNKKHREVELRTQDKVTGSVHTYILPWNLKDEVLELANI